MKLGTAIGAVVAAAVLAAAPLAPAVAAQPVHRPSARAHTAVLVGPMLHLPNGRVERVPLGRSGRWASLLGHTSRGWIIGMNSYFVYDGTSVTRLGSRGSSEPGNSELLSSDRTHVVQSFGDRYGDPTSSSQLALDGTVQAFPYVPDGALISDALGDRAYAVDVSQDEAGIYELVAGAGDDGAVRLSNRPTRLVDIEHDVAFVDPDHQRRTGTGPVSLSKITGGGDPAPRWQVTTCRSVRCSPFTPTKISPDGRLVLGDASTPKGIWTQVRRMSDGRLLRSFSTTYEDHIDYRRSTSGWDGPGSRAILQVVVPHPGRTHPTRYLRRCIVATGRCTRLTGTTTSKITISTAMAGPRAVP